jgi:hypothetical protein
MQAKILTRHPDPGKSGVNISKQKYDQIRDAILEELGAGDEVTFQGLTQAVGQKLRGRFEGSIPWYVTTVKLDLEARGLIQRIPDSSPQRLRLSPR